MPDALRAREVVARIFYDVGADTLARTTVEVVADTAPHTPTADARARLLALGIRVLRIRTTANPGPAMVIVHRGNIRVAGIVAGLVGGIPVAGGTRPGGPDLTILLAGVSTAPAGGLPR